LGVLEEGRLQRFLFSFEKTSLTLALLVLGVLGTDDAHDATALDDLAAVA